MTDRYDVLAVREYVSHGEKKTAWTNVGVAFQSRDGRGFSVFLHAIPAPQDGQYKLVLREPQARDDRASPSAGSDDQIPF